MDRFFQELLGRSKYVAEGLDYIVRLGPTTDQAEMIREELRATGQDPNDEKLISVKRTRFSRIMDEFQKDIPFQVLTPERPKKLTLKGQELRKVLLDIKGILRGSVSNDDGTISICGVESLLSTFIEPNCVPFMEALKKEFLVWADMCRKKPGTITDEQLEQKRRLAGLRARISVSGNDDFAIKSVKNGWADLAVVSGVNFKSLGKIDKKDLHHVPLGEEKYLLALPCEQHQLASFLTKAQAGQLPLVKLRGQGAINQKLKKMYPKADWRIDTTNFEGVRRILEKSRTMGGILTSGAAVGLKYTFVPCKIFNSDSNRCELICRKDSYSVPKISAFVHYMEKGLKAK